MAITYLSRFPVQSTQTTALFLVSQRSTVMKAHEIVAAEPVTPAPLLDVYDRLRGGRAEPIVLPTPHGA